MENVTGGGGGGDAWKVLYTLKKQSNAYSINGLACSTTRISVVPPSHVRDMLFVAANGYVERDACSVAAVNERVEREKCTCA